MSQPMPSWFAADHVFASGPGWYIGSPQGFRVGPYPGQAAAEQRSREITAKLERCADTREAVRAVRAFLFAQNAHEGRQLHSGPASSVSAVLGTVDTPPLRAGESRRVWFRTSRFFSVDEVWFFATREDIDVGPYESKAAAECDAGRLLKILRETDSETECRLAIYQFKSRPMVYARSA